MNYKLRKEHFYKLINPVTSNEAYDLKLKYFPSKLYKYCKIEDNQNINLGKTNIINSPSYSNILFNLWYLSDPNRFDDIFDGDITGNKIITNDKVVDVSFKDFEKLEEIKPLLSISLERINEDFKRFSKITCFSENFRDNIMWSKYANEHQGFCVEYDFSKVENNMKRTFYPIYYSNKKNNRSIKDFNDIISCFLQKDENWKFNKEWRLIIGEKEMEIIRIKNKNNINLIESFAPMSSIYLGLKMSEENVNIMRQFSKKYKIDLYKSIKGMDKNRNVIDFYKI